MKTGRNDPCPCASGKKFKKCCAPNAGEPTVPAAAAAEAPTAVATEAAPVTKAGRPRVNTWTPLHEQVGALWPSRMSRKKPK